MQRLYERQAYSSQVGSFWETTTQPVTWPRLAKDIKAKVVIIGGGYTGLNCALELEKAGFDPATIVILEAEQPGWGASGRNGG
ncbi:MAG: FAD-binding oxidoreductase, partial [Salaquimonas sp.]